MIVQRIQAIVKNTLNYLVDNGVFPDEILTTLANIAIDTPKNPDHGDYAVNAAMVLAKVAKKPPRVVAEELVRNWQDPDGLIETSEIAGPGFINIRVSNQALQGLIRDVLQLGEAFGASAKKNKRVLVEFVSANPTGPIHLGHARSAFLGDAACRLLIAAGFDVTREFYLNDAGNQVKVLGKSIYARYRQLFGEEIQLGKDEYPGAYIIDIATTLKNQDGDKWLNVDEEQWLPKCIEFAIDENLKLIRQTLAHAGISMDQYFSEKSLHQKGALKDLVAEYKKRDMLYDAARPQGADERIRREDSKAAKYADQQLGGTFLKTMQYGDEEDRILVKANGDFVYLTADLAYHRDKFERGYDRIIDVFGADHAGHIPRIKASMQALGFDEKKLEFLVVQIVRLIRGGEEVRFSKRSGEIYLLDDLLDEVGPDATRFMFLMRAPNSQYDFDLDLALKQSNENPVFYVQYGHARMATLLKRAAEAGQPFGALGQLTDIQLSRLKLPEERNMLKSMDAFPGVVESAAAHLEPHRILYFCQELISLFHEYFTKYRHSERVISSDLDLTQGRLALVFALKQTLFNALSILGISAPDHMKAPEEEEA